MLPTSVNLVDRTSGGARGRLAAVLGGLAICALVLGTGLAGCGKSDETGAKTPPATGESGAGGAEQPEPAEPAEQAEQPEQPDEAEPAEQPDEAEPAEKPGESEPPDKPPTTPDECRAAGGRFVASTGGAPACPEGTREIAQIRFGLEGGLCCK